MSHLPRMTLALLTLCIGNLAVAKLPPPSPEQQQAAAAKKQQAASQAEKEKQELTAAMDRVTSYWRQRASSEGWKTNPPTSAGKSGESGQGGKEAAPPPMPIRSEKLGTAPPSPDPKNPAEKGK